MTLPREHGAWGMLLQPFFGALLALRGVAWPVWPALACVLLVFLVREPLIVLARQRWIWREPHPETRQARQTVAVEVALLVAAAGALLFAWPFWWLAALGSAAVLLTALAVYITVRNRQRAVWFQALSAAGLSGSCLAACLAVTGEIPVWCWWWWALHAIHFLTGILVVHVRLETRILAHSGKPTDKNPARHARVAQTASAIAAIGLLFLGHLNYGLAMLFSASVHHFDLATVASAMPMMKVGLRALAVSIVFTAVLIAGVWLG